MWLRPGLIVILLVCCMGQQEAFLNPSRAISIDSVTKLLHSSKHFNIKTNSHILRQPFPILQNDKDTSLFSAKVSETPEVTAKQDLPAYYKFFPVKVSELPKFGYLSTMLFWIVFVFTMTRDTKDALIVTNCGAESIAFLKVYGVIPAATAFMLAYAKLSSVLPPRALFYAILLPFFAFYTTFAFVLYPLRGILHPSSLVLPAGGLSYAVNLIKHWTFSLYFVVSELWGSAGVPLLFWTCANDVVKIDEASRLYPIIPIISNLAPILSGICMSTVSNQVKLFTKDDDSAFELSLKILTGLMLGAGVLIASCHHLVRNLQSKEKALNPVTEPPAQDRHSSHSHSSKPKPSLLQSLKLLAKDRYLRNVGLMVMSYGLSIELTEIAWKATVKKAFPSRSEYLAFNGRASTMVGVASAVMMLIGSSIVKRLGWRAGALTPPAMMGILALPFFFNLIFRGVAETSGPLTAAGKQALLTAVYVGLVQNVISKGTKYAVFDPTKEMAYIPLDKDAKTKGKAAIDVLGARLGKSGGALIQQLLVVAFGNIITGAPVLAGMFYLVISVWIMSVNDLAPMFQERAVDYII